MKTSAYKAVTRNLKSKNKLCTRLIGLASHASEVLADSARHIPELQEKFKICYNGATTNCPIRACYQVPIIAKESPLAQWKRAPIRPVIPVFLFQFPNKHLANQTF